MYLSNKKTYQKNLAERNQKYRAQLDLHREELKERQEDQVHILFEIHGDPDVLQRREEPEQLMGTLPGR